MKILIGAVLSLLALNVNAVLIERLGGLAYYDTDADLTWLADANYAQTSGRDAEGTMSWYTSTAWLENLAVGGVTGWRLPETVQPDGSCDSQQTNRGYGYNCTGSEMGNMFYNVLGGSADSSISTNHNSNYDLFSNIQIDYRTYWSTTLELSGWEGSAYIFRFGDGIQTSTSKSGSDATFTWAVYSGDVGEIVTPVPSAVWLFGSGLLGLIGVARRKASA